MLKNINVYTELVLGGGAPAFSAALTTSGRGNVSRVAPTSSTVFPAFYPVWAEARLSPAGPWP